MNVLKILFNLAFNAETSKDVTIGSDKNKMYDTFIVW